jgi:hypothetical protein
MAGNYYTSKYGTRINVAGLSGGGLNKVKTLANNQYGTKAAQVAKNLQTKIPKVTPPVVPGVTPPPANPTITPINNQQPAPAAVQGAPDPAATQALFPTTRMFEPKNYEGSPLYQFQVKAGQDQLKKSLAAKGLVNSGAAIKQELDIPMQAAAQDTDRMTRLASENADRLYNMQNNESQRLERQDNNQWDRRYSLAQLMAEQSPWQAALQGLGNSADITKAAGSSQANYLRDAYQRIIASGGGGGGGRGGGSSAPLAPAAQIDMSKINQAGLINGINNQTGTTNLLTNTLASFPWGSLFS